MRSMTKELNYKENKLENRLKEVERILNIRDMRGLNEFERYFDTRYKCGLTSNDALSDENTYCRALEQMADYILGSEEVREDRKNKQEYRFYMDEKEFKRRTKKENVYIEGMVQKAKSKTGFEDGDSVIDFLKKKDNFLKPKVQTITNEDLKKSDRLGQVLRDYKQYEDYLAELLTMPTHGDGYKIRRIKGSIREDMINAKDSLNGVFGYVLRHGVKSDYNPDYSGFDWTNKEHIKYLMYIQREFMPDDNLSLLLLDLDRLVAECIENKLLSPKEIEVYSMIRLGYKNIEIAKELGTNKQRISNISNSISTKLAKEIIKRG